jgi:hypothetical protein
MAPVIEERRFIQRGFLAGGIAGLLAFVFSKIFAEPQVQAAINYESARDAAQDALDKAAGIAVPPAGPDIFSRGVQGTIGIGVGLLVFGIAIGGIFAVAYVMAARRSPDFRPRQLALKVAGFGFLAMFLIPFLKYPANPPAIGHEETIGTRSLLYVVMAVISMIVVIGGLYLRSRVTEQLGSYNATLLTGAVAIVVIAIVMLILPPLGHLHANVAEYGRHATETPLPLTDKSGHIVFTGFPADLLWRFRLYSVLNQVILWGGIGLVFGELAERLVASAVRRSELGDDARAAAPITA